MRPGNVNARCKACHDPAIERAPSRAELAIRPRGDIVSALTTGIMAPMAKGLTQDEFAKKAAAFLATLNVIHTFREGNGRAQLSFLLLLSENADHPLDLAHMDPAAMLEAMIASFFGDERPLKKILCDMIA